jgi:uncharacterized protein DUF4345
MTRNILLFIVAASALIEIIVGGSIMIVGLRGLTELLEGQMLLADLISQLDKTDSEIRFFAGMRLTIGLGFLYALYNLKGRLPVLYLSFLAMFMGGVGRLIGIVLIGGDGMAVVFTVIELSIPLIGFWLSRRI